MLNGTNQYIFNIYHYLLNLRDTMEYTIDREHSKELYDQRKAVLTNGLKTGSALGNFLDNNKEQGDKIREKLNEFLSDLYGEESTILKITEDGKVRVDHTQHVKLFDEVVGLQESIRDILYGYLNFARSKNESDEDMMKMVALDEKMTRTIIAMLIMREFQKSFGEFQKVMAESKGQPTPQSNFIVQNELVKMAGYLRFSRQHTRATDNETLDLLDETLKVIEMTEGRRQRPNNRGFKDIFDELNNKLNTYAAKVEAAWKATYAKVVEEVTKNQPKPQQPADNQIN